MRSPAIADPRINPPKAPPAIAPTFVFLSDARDAAVLAGELEEVLVVTLVDVLMAAELVETVFVLLGMPRLGGSDSEAPCEKVK